MNPILSDHITFDIRNGYPMGVTFPQKLSITAFREWFVANEAFLSDHLRQVGAILFRGILIQDDVQFHQLMDDINPLPFDYVNGNSPRTKLSAKVYTSTEYDPSLPITLHNELSYASRWPSRLFFCCITPAATGGETPIADSRRVLQEMAPELVEEIGRKKIRYIRNLHGGRGLGPSWQHTFETEDRKQVEEYCRSNKVNFLWKRDGGLKLEHFSDGIITHPDTGERVWFNQIDQFHPCHLSPEVYSQLMIIFKEEQHLPMYVSFGDGSRISEAMVGEISSVINKVMVKHAWEQSDLLLVDNILSSHGRMPFTGQRKVLVSMCGL